MPDELAEELEQPLAALIQQIIAYDGVLDPKKKRGAVFGNEIMNILESLEDNGLTGVDIDALFRDEYRANKDLLEGNAQKLTNLKEIYKQAIIEMKGTEGDFTTPEEEAEAEARWSGVTAPEAPAAAAAGGRRNRRRTTRKTKKSKKTRKAKRSTRRR